MQQILGISVNMSTLLSHLDGLIVEFDRALRVLSGAAAAARPNPAHGHPDTRMSERERRTSGGLMRVNHVGEVCAQALYQGQAFFARSDELRQKYRLAGREEEDHLAWTAERLHQLGTHPSLLNPVWYFGAYALGGAAALLGDRISLGFVVETERQVEAHLAGHMTMLPSDDARSRAIVDRMRLDEMAHGQAAQALGATVLPWPVRTVMRGAAKVMTTVAYYI